MKKIIISLSIIGAVAAIIIGATTAFFSDTETSTGNVFTAGAIDLKIDNESWYYGPEGLVYREDLSWELDDLTGHLFFNYSDLKPGDWGEDTVSIHVHDNPAWLCLDILLTSNNENDIVEPEEELGDTSEIGELADELWFIGWPDDGDNVLEDDEAQYVIGPTKLGDAWLNQPHTIPLADSNGNIWDPAGAAIPLEGETTYYIGKFWCYGELTLDPVVQDGYNDIGPNERAAGVDCDGAPVTNLSQTDSATLDVSFYAVQSRNNMDFVCTANYYSRTRVLRLENKTDDPEWDPLTDNMHGQVTFKSPYSTFDFDLQAYGLNASTEYCLIYYADGWPGNNPGALIWSGNTDGSGEIDTSGSIDLGMDLPDPADANHPTGAKIWLVPCSDYDKVGFAMTAWNEADYLFEWNLITYDDTDI